MSERLLKNALSLLDELKGAIQDLANYMEEEAKARSDRAYDAGYEASQKEKT